MEDEAFFRAVFDNCDLKKLEETITDDFEFYHDQNGLVATSKEQFVTLTRTQCAKRASGEISTSRRELVPGSLEVYPLNNYGAIQSGVHRFIRVEAGKPDQPTGIAKFTHVWKLEDGAWRIARVLSYDHQPVE